MKISTFTICDDIRFELDNKISLMGVYEDVILFKTTKHDKGKWPKHFSFAALIRVELEEKDIEAGIAAIGLIVRLNKKETKIVKIEIDQRNIAKGKRLGLTPKFGNFPVDGTGVLSIKIVALNKDNKELYFKETPKIKVVETEA